MNLKLLALFLLASLCHLQLPVFSQTIDPIKLSVETTAKQVSLNDDVTFTIKARYVSAPSNTAFVFNASNSFRLKFVFPDGFVQTGGDYRDFVGTTLSPANPTVTYTVKGRFIRQTNDRDFKLLRGGANANDQSHYKLVSTLPFSVIKPEQIPADGSARQSALFDFESHGSLQYMTIAQLRASVADSARAVYIIDEGREGVFLYDSLDTSSADDGSMVIVSNGHRYIRKIQNSVVNVEYFGAVGDFDGTNGKDNTLAFQRGINYLIARGGGVLEVPNKKYKVSGTISINPSSHVAITVKGNVLNTRPNGNTLGLPSLIKDTDGDLFRVNLKDDGSANILYPNGYASLAVSGLEVKAKDTSISVVGFKMWRTRVVMQGVSGSNLSYLVLQPDKDALDSSNYCDHSRFQDIRIANSKNGGLQLYGSDASFVNGLYLESTTASFKNLLTVRSTRSMSISGVNFWTPTAYTPTDGSRIIDITSCKGVSLENIHIERSWVKDIFYFASTDGIKVSGITTEFLYNTAFRFRYNNKNVSISNWSAKADVNAGGSDIAVDEGPEHGEFTLNNITLVNQNGSSRSILVKNISTIATDNLLRKYVTAPYSYNEKKLTDRVLASDTGSLAVPDIGYTVFLADDLGGGSASTLTLPALPATKEGRIKIINRSTSTTWSIPNMIERRDGRISYLPPKGATVELVPGKSSWLVENVIYSFGIVDWDSIQGSKFVSSGSTALHRPAVNGGGTGIQAIVGDVPGSKKQLVNFDGSWYKRDITNQVAGNWYKIFDEQSVIREQNMTKTASYQVLETDFGNNGQLTIYANATNGPFIITCPPAANMNKLILNVVKVDGTPNEVTVKGSGSEKIGAANTDILNTQYQTQTYRSSGVQIFKF